jgi:hypothetical protein
MTLAASHVPKLSPLWFVSSPFRCPKIVAFGNLSPA